MSITESRAFGNLNRVLDHKDEKFVKEKEQDKTLVTQWKIGYSTHTGKTKYRKLDDLPRQFKDQTVASLKSEHNLRTIQTLSDTFARSGVEQMKARMNEHYEKLRDGKEFGDGPLSDEAELEMMNKLDTKLTEQIRAHVQEALGFVEGKYTGVERVTVGQVKGRISEVDEMVQSMVDDFVARFDPDKGLTEKTKETVTTMVSPNMVQNMGNVIGELKGRQLQE